MSEVPDLEQFTIDMELAMYDQMNEELPPRSGNWGGAREGAGRPGIKNSVRVRVSPDIAEFVGNPANYQKIWNLMNDS
jgi:hypothetical protein